MDKNSRPQIESKETSKETGFCPDCLLHRGIMVALISGQGWVGNAVIDLLVCDFCGYENIVGGL